MAVWRGVPLIQVKAAVRRGPTIDVMPVASQTLADHHRQCEELFAAAQRAAAASDWSSLPERVGALREALLEHFHYEEDRLFPLYEEASGNEGSTEAFCAQHDDMRAALWVLATMSPGEEPRRYRAELAALNTAFDVHAAEEERRMYPEFERILRRPAWP
jgi:hemerythrin superfamily protein